MPTPNDPSSSHPSSGGPSTAEDADPDHLIGQLREGSTPAWLRTAAAIGWRLLVVGAVVVAAAIVITRLRVLVVPLLFGLLLAAALSPPVRWLAGRGIPSIMATWLVLLVAAAVVIGLGWALLPTLADGFTGLGDAVVDAYDDVRDWLVDGPIGLEPGTIDAFEDRVISRLQDFAETGIADRATLALEVATGFFLTLVITFFYLKDGVRFRSMILDRVPPRDRGRTESAMLAGWWVVQRYLLGVVIVGAVDAALIGIGLAVIGVPYIGPIVVLTFLAAFFPLVGAIFAGGVAALLALASGGVGDALLVVALTVAVQQIDGDVIAPLVYGRAVDLHPLAILMALTAGAVIAGIIGAFLAVPVLAASMAAVGAWRDAAEPVREGPERGSPTSGAE